MLSGTFPEETLWKHSIAGLVKETIGEQISSSSIVPFNTQPMAIDLVHLESLTIDLPRRPQAKMTYDTPQYSLACRLLSQPGSLIKLQISSYNFDSANNRFTESPLSSLNPSSFRSLTTLRIELEVLVDGPLEDPYQGFLLDGALLALGSLEVIDLTLIMIVFGEDATFEEGIPRITPGIFRGDWNALDKVLAPGSPGTYKLSIHTLKTVDILIQLMCFERGVVDDEEILDQVEDEIRGLRRMGGNEASTNFEGLERLARRGVLRRFNLCVEEYTE